MNSILYTYNNMITRIVHYIFTLIVLITILDEFPLRNYIINPIIYIIKVNPQLIGYVFVSSLLLNLINEILKLIYNAKKFYNKLTKESEK